MGLQHDDEDERGEADRHLEQVRAKVVHGVVDETDWKVKRMVVSSISSFWSCYRYD